MNLAEGDEWEVVEGVNIITSRPSRFSQSQKLDPQSGHNRLRTNSTGISARVYILECALVLKGTKIRTTGFCLNTLNIIQVLHHRVLLLHC